VWHIGIDLHRKTLVIAAVHDSGEVRPPTSFACSDVQGIVEHMKRLQPFRAVVEATGTYRWLYRLLRPFGTMLLVHPLTLRAMIQRRCKTDRLDAQLLANLLRINQLPLAYIPSDEYQLLRDITRHRARMGRGLAGVKTGLRAMLARHNMDALYKCPFGPRGLYWFSKQDFDLVDNAVRDELLLHFQHYTKQMAAIDAHLAELRPKFPQVEVLMELYGIGLFSALLIIGELGEVERFRNAKQAGAYTGLTPRVSQSGAHDYHGHISRQGSPWLRWILIEAAMKLVRRDLSLANFYTRIRKRSSAKIARGAAARKLAEICWKRLRRWQREHGEQVAA
jgi:transposase